MSTGAGLFGISAVVWIALVAMLHFALEGPVGRLRRADLAVLAVGVACCLLPSIITEFGHQCVFHLTTSQHLIAAIQFHEIVLVTIEETVL